MAPSISGRVGRRCIARMARWRSPSCTPTDRGSCAGGGRRCAGGWAVRYRIAIDRGRGIGVDVLYGHANGTEFSHPMHADSDWKAVELSLRAAMELLKFLPAGAHIIRQNGDAV